MSVSSFLFTCVQKASLCLDRIRSQGGDLLSPAEGAPPVRSPPPPSLRYHSDQLAEDRRPISADLN